MSIELEPFHGTWKFDPALSTMCTPAPHSWVQEISGCSESVAVHEKIVRPDGTGIVSRVQAKFDGVDYPVEGSPTVDTISYTRADRNAICGIGKKDGRVAVTETVLADPEKRTLTLIYNYLLGEQSVAHGVAVFQEA